MLKKKSENELTYRRNLSKYNFFLISGHKEEGKLCGSDINNCDKGLSCIWDGQDNGVGICKSSVGKAVKCLENSVFSTKW